MVAKKRVSNWLPWALLGLVVLWAIRCDRPHPNHPFMLQLVSVLQEREADIDSDSTEGQRSGDAPRNRAGEHRNRLLPSSCYRAQDEYKRPRR